jgi:hypothetical protein
VLAVSAALNAQARYGADVMSRLHFAVLGGGQHQLETLIRQQIGALIEQLLFRRESMGPKSPTWSWWETRSCTTSSAGSMPGHSPLSV